MLIRIFVSKSRNTDILFCQFVLDGCGNFFCMILTVGSDTHIEGTELASRYTQTLHALPVHKEESQVHELRRRHKGMADQARNGQDAFLVIDLENDRIANPHFQELRRHSFKATSFFPLGHCRLAVEAVHSFVRQSCPASESHPAAIHPRDAVYKEWILNYRVQHLQRPEYLSD